jgi:riboflavin synthase
MFTGIIEGLATVKKLSMDKGNMEIAFETAFVKSLKRNNSVAHNGVCLSVDSVSGILYTVVAIEETLEKTNLKNLKVGDKVNVERSVKANGRMEGHFVLGHVDGTVKCKSVKKLEGSHIFSFAFDKKDRKYMVDKGSITLNGVALTIAELTSSTLSVAIIPYTFSNTNFQFIKPGDKVNVEYDILGKYVLNCRGMK